VDECKPLPTRHNRYTEDEDGDDCDTAPETIGLNRVLDAMAREAASAARRPSIPLDIPSNGICVRRVGAARAAWSGAYVSWIRKCHEEKQRQAKVLTPTATWRGELQHVLTDRAAGRTTHNVFVTVFVTRCDPRPGR
jgi:hypothetical protein